MYRNQPSKSDYEPSEGTYESEFRNRLEFFNQRYKKTICNDIELRSSLMGDDYKVSMQNMLSLKINK